MRGWPIITYRLMVMANTVNNETANKPYRNNGYRRHSSSPCVQARFQNVLAASGKLKQQNSKSDNDRFMMNTAVALRTCNNIMKNQNEMNWLSVHLIQYSIPPQPSPHPCVVNVPKNDEILLCRK